MGFMKPVAEFMEALIVETDCGTEVIPGNIVEEEHFNLLADNQYEDMDEEIKDILLSYCEGKEINGFEVKEGWFSRLSASGYLDCTSWCGPFKTEEKALKAVMVAFEVDESGDTAE